MGSVIVCSTNHIERGRTTVSALLEVLKRTRPNVVFLEIPEADFPNYNTGVRSNLESSAARQYRQDNEVILVPVDSPIPRESFFRDFQYLDRRVAATSPTYRGLIDHDSHRVATQGFTYLNSPESGQAWSAIYEAMQEAVHRLAHDRQLREIFEQWRTTHDLREREMLRKIDRFFSENPFEKGILLVGAAHAEPIIQKARIGRDPGAPTISRVEIPAT
jgi:hypothetical protein